LSCSSERIESSSRDVGCAEAPRVRARARARARVRVRVRVGVRVKG
jgi:hypothetical protein